MGTEVHYVYTSIYIIQKAAAYDGMGLKYNRWECDFRKYKKNCFSFFYKNIVG